MKNPIIHTVIKDNGFIPMVSDPANKRVICQNVPSVPRYPTVPRPMSRDNGTGQHNNQRKNKGGRQ